MQRLYKGQILLSYVCLDDTDSGQFKKGNVEDTNMPVM